MIEINNDDMIRKIISEKVRDLLREHFKRMEKKLNASNWLFEEVKTKTKNILEKRNQQYCIKGKSFNECDHMDLLNIVIYGGRGSKKLIRYAKIIKDLRNDIFFHPLEYSNNETADSAFSNLIAFVKEIDPDSNLLKDLKELRLENLREAGEIGPGPNPPPRLTQPRQTLTVGYLAKTYITNALTQGKVSAEEVKKLMDMAYSREQFNAHGWLFPVLKEQRVPKMRYAKDPVSFNGKIYYISTQWYDNQREFLEDWAVRHGIELIKTNP